MKHALTIDLEDWHQLLARRIGRTIEPSHAVVSATRHLLDLLDEARTRATFFVVGMVAERYPELVKAVAQRGHEIGSHSHAHRLVHSGDRSTFRNDMRRSVSYLRELTGQPVLGFRAPEFSIPSLDHWAFEVLAEVGVQYDSSVFPVTHARYGNGRAPRRPFVINTKSGAIREFPLATWRIARRNLSVAGGSYFRLIPSILLARALRALEGERLPAVLYFHPYEFHADTLRLEDLSWRQRVRPAYAKYRILHNVATRRIEARLVALLRSFQFVPLGEMCADLNGERVNAQLTAELPS